MTKSGPCQRARLTKVSFALPESATWRRRSGPSCWNEEFASTSLARGRSLQHFCGTDRRRESKKTKDWIQSQIPVKRFGTPEEIAAVLYLTSPESPFVLGGKLIVDGGMATL